MNVKIRSNHAASLTAAAGVAAVLFMASSAAAAEFGSGPNISGEVTADDHRAQRDRERQEQMYLGQRPMAAAPGMPVDPMRIDVPRRPDGLPQRPVRGLSRTEEMEMDDLEHRYQMGLIGDAEYYSRRNAIMERVGLEPEY